MIAFDAFLRTVRGHDPYPWQQALAARLAAEPSAIDQPPTPLAVTVPTGSGKTTVVDVLVWVLAAQADRAPQERTVGARIVWAIDRRLLVDEVHAGALVLARALADALADADDPLHAMARRLETLKGDAAGAPPEPLAVTRWRGGLERASDALHHPLQAEVITSTVAQVGSRLLFRGYGLGDGSLPLGAALAGCDTTICLDEAHLAVPFADTVAAIRGRRRGFDATVAPGLRLLRLSATADEDDDPTTHRIDLTAADAAVPALARRLQAPKLATLVEPAGTTDRDQETALVAAVEEHLAAERRTIACVVNSVRTARAVFDRLCAHAAKVAAPYETALLVGPQRPADRRRTLARTLPLGGESADEGGGAGETTVRDVLLAGARPGRPLVVVATQTFEVGLDADVEALVTQSASGAALAQRLGRLNRTGALNAGDHAAGIAPHADGRATVIRHVGFPLYADDEDRAWRWLAEELPRDPNGDVDVSVATLRRIPPPPTTRRPHAAELTDQAVELLTQTSPRPHPLHDPDIDAFLRGADADADSDVTVCWRADLEPDHVGAEADAYRDALLRLVPADRDEQLTMSLSAARNLLLLRTGRGRASMPAGQRLVTDVPDVEGGPPSAGAPGDAPPRFFGVPFLVRRGREVLRGATPADGPDDPALRIADLRPGDQLILPTSLGGVDEHGLAPTSPAGTDVAGDLRASDGSDAHPDAIRLTPKAAELALAAQGPAEAARVRRLLRRTAGAERRLVTAADDDQRRDVLAGLLDAWRDHPALATSGWTPDTVELRRLTPPPPGELLERADPIDELFFGVDEQDEDLDRDDAEPDDGRGALLEGEEEPFSAGAWVLLRRSATPPDRVRARDDAPPTIDAHARAVARRASAFAAAARLDDRLQTVLHLAARVHDHGKADPRMQAFFRGGTGLPFAEPIAKSTFGTDDRQADRQARLASGLPTGFRHELASVEVLRDVHGRGASGLDDAVSLDLAAHLVAVHHGRSLPVPPVPAVGAPARRFAVDAAGLVGTATGGDAEAWDDGEPLRRLDRLAGRYDPWTLAYLQALLVLADRTVSAEGR